VPAEFQTADPLPMLAENVQEKEHSPTWKMGEITGGGVSKLLIFISFLFSFLFSFSAF
jgi:hypothetical protein